MLDKLLGVGASFDYFSPLAGFLGDLLNRGGHGFIIDWSSCPMSGVEVERLLRRRGVRTWGLMTVGDKLLVSVPKDKAAWASHLLDQAGVPVENPLPTGQGASRTWGRTRATRSSIVSRSRLLRSLKGGRR